MGRPVEAELLLELADEVQVAVPARRDSARRRRRCFRPGPARRPSSAAARDARRGARVRTLGLGDDALDGPPGANCTIAKEMSMIPSRVGTIRGCDGRCRRASGGHAHAADPAEMVSAKPVGHFAVSQQAIEPDMRRPDQATPSMSASAEASPSPRRQAGRTVECTVL